jgi:hypothetical protein
VMHNPVLLTSSTRLIRDWPKRRGVAGMSSRRALHVAR